jgi:RHS repeat-associated protein
VYNSSNELNSKPGVTYTYDNNGNTLTKVVGSNTTSFTWDFENRLSSVTLPGSGGTVSFKYDAFGRHIYKSSSSTTSIYMYDGDNLIEETNSVGTPVARYSQGLNIDEPLAVLRSSTTSYYQADGLGSVTSLTNSSGANAATYTYDSFGNLTNSTGTLTNPFRYTARESDAETGLYYYRARYYDSNVGRFISEDPIRFRAGINFFRYVRNRAVNFVDPTGNSPWTWGSNCVAFMYFYVKCADKGTACKLKLLQNAPSAVNPSDSGNGDLLGQLSNTRNGQGTGFEGCMNLAECMGKETDCQKMGKYGVQCGAWAIGMMGSLMPDPPPSLSKP